MTEMPSFIDELVDEQEQLESRAICDQTLRAIGELEAKIQETLTLAEEEQSLIQSWALQRSSRYQEKIDMLSRKLESFIRDAKEKTIQLPHGTLRLRKRQDKVEVENLELFLQHAPTGTLSIVPESAKPDIAGIKSFLKMTGGKVPPGVKVIPGQETFSYKLKDNTNGTDTEEEIGADSR